LAAFDGLAAPPGPAAPKGQAWTDDASWTFYALPAGFSGDASGPVVAPDGALWIGSQDSVARFDPSLAEEESPDAAWTVYRNEGGVVGGGFGPIAFEPGGEIWFGATRFDPARAEGGLAAP
jgi:hypothetical protein